jgi:hypothetical protein
MPTISELMAVVSTIVPLPSGFSRMTVVDEMHPVNDRAMIKRITIVAVLIVPPGFATLEVGGTLGKFLNHEKREPRGRESAKNKRFRDFQGCAKYRDINLLLN